jgi:cellulose synthase (UDP-forming)
LRALALGFGAAALIVHLLWRVQYSFDGLPTTGVVFSGVLFAMETVIAMALVIGALAAVLPSSIIVDPIAVPEHELPTIDVFVLISNTRQVPKAAYSLAVASQLDYPRDLVRLYLVGHGQATENSASLIALAERTRASWLSASSESPAGSAINAALARSSGSLVLVLNAGDAPTPDLARRVAGGFVINPRLALCDVATFLIDGDPMLTDIDVTQRLPNDPGHYFKSCLKAPSTIDSALGLGLRAIWRRAALSGSGSLTRSNDRPDAIARIRAAEQAWQRGVVERPMIATIAPDTVRDYLHARLSQRIGMIDATMARDPLFSRGLSMRERLSWLPSIFASLLPFAWAMLFAIPPLAVLLNVPLIAALTASEGILVSLGAFFTALMMAGTLNAGMRNLLIGMWSEQLESLLSAQSAMSMLRGRQTDESTPDVDSASNLLVVLFALLLAGTTASVAALYLKAAMHPALASAGALTIFSACFVACLLGAIAEPRQRRLSPRVNRRFQAELLLGGETFFGRLSDISVHGARFIADELVDLPARAFAGVITLNGPSGRSTLPVQLSRQTESAGRTAFGLAFTGRTVGEFATVVRLAHKSGDAYADICDARAKPMGVMKLLPILTLRGIGTFFSRLLVRRQPKAQFIRFDEARKKGT